jgi:lipopolysaccharide/colanic/teichoic acid biosynthesis glycosyltransferase
VQQAEQLTVAAPTFYERRGKRALDVLGAALMGALAAPLMGATALAVWATQGRPVLFHQVRVGRDDRDFVILKLRTMVPGAATQGAGMWFEPADPRVTPIGRVLRASSLDELPQVWNVLRGDMSLVGPRPKPRVIVDRYKSRYRETLRVRPGLTSLASVEGRNTLRRSQLIESDLRYVRRITLAGDLRILLRTAWVVLSRKGFYAEDESEEWMEDLPADPA